MPKILLVAGLLDSGDIPRIIRENLSELGNNTEFLPADDALPLLEYSLHSKGKRHSRLSVSLFSRRLYRRVKRFKPDILLLYGSNWSVLPETLRKIKRDFACKVILWEGNIQFWRWFQVESLQYYDVVFVNDSYVIPLLRGPAKLGNVVHMPFNMCDPNIHRPLDLTEEERNHYGSDIGFIGMGHRERRKFFEKLTDFDLKLWGKEWDRSVKLKPFFIDERVGMEEKIRIYQCARINVNIQSERYQIDGISAKIFEIAACGGFFLTERKKDLSRFFKEEEGLISFGNIDELREKIDHYLARPEEARRLAVKMREKVIRNYTYKIKLRELMSYIQ